MLRGFRAAFGAVLAWTLLAVAWGQRPSDSDAAALIEKSRERALAYAHTLPDFVCTELIQRYQESRSTAARTPSRSVTAMSVSTGRVWTSTDKLAVRLSFFEQKEEHKLVLRNDKPTDLKYEALAGGTGSGEFGGTLRSIFDPDSQTEFHWEGWKNVRRHRAAVYTYRVAAEHSGYEVANGTVGGLQKAVVAFHGDLEIDRDTGDVLHFTYVADQIPKEVKLDRVSTSVDYDFADVGGRDYLLPSHSELLVFSAILSVRNDMDFREYRKFSADSVIDFTVGK
jgi:hypothetical protein